MNKTRLNIKIIIPVVIAVFGLIGYGYSRIFSLSDEVSLLESELASTTAIFAGKTDRLESADIALDQKLTLLSSNLSATDQDIQKTKKNVETVQSQVGGVEQTVGKITGAVSALEKLSKTDPELLQKYSKVFFLNEHYAPERLSEINSEYLYSEKKTETIDRKSVV